MTLALYKRRYEHTGDLKQALYVVGDNHDFESITQTAFMQIAGLRPNHKFLDFGCGCLRGTAKLVDYLDDGNFFGTDVSEGLLGQSYRRLEEMGIKKTPCLQVLNDYNLEELFKEKFDFILSVSVLTHILSHDLPALFSGISKVLKPRGIWYFTIYPTEEAFSGNVEIMRYNKQYLKDVAEQNGLYIEDISGDFPNPSPGIKFISRVNTPLLGQWVMRATPL